MKKIFYLTMLCLFIPFYTVKAQNAAKMDSYEISVGENAATQYYLGINNSWFFPGTSSFYEFIDAQNQYNIVYELDGNNDYLGWTVLDSNFNLIKTMKIKRYLTMFGNAVYKNGYLYVVYGAIDTKTTSSSSTTYGTTETISVIKYNTNGDVVKALLLPGYETSRMDVWNKSTVFKGYGSAIPFRHSNVAMDINKSNTILKVTFGRQMYNGHQSSFEMYFDTNTLEYLNRPSTMDFDNKYYHINNEHTMGHTFNERVLATEDDQFISVYQTDAEPQRGFIVQKNIDNEGNDEKITTFHFRESTNDAGKTYNYTFANLGNIVEVQDGYLLIASSEKTLSLNYASSTVYNESRNLFIQKYNKNINSNSTAQNIQMFTTATRNSESQRTDVADLGEFHLDNKLNTDYGVKWLTNYSGDKTVLESRAVTLENKNVAIIWVEAPVITLSSGKKTYESDTTAWKYYYEIIDKNGNVVQSPLLIEGATPSVLIKYNTKGNYIYWSQNSKNQNKIIVNRLDITKQQEALTFERTSAEEQTLEYSDYVKNKKRLAVKTNKDTTITWSSSNRNVAEVDQNGVLTLKKTTGTVTITAKSVEYNVSVKWKIHVNYTPTLEMNREKYQFKNLYTTLMMGATYNGVEVKDLTWSSSNEKVATVDESGYISPVSGGFAVITATSSAYGSADCIVYVASPIVLDDLSSGYVGDINKDGKIDATDAEKIMEIANKINYGLTPEQQLVSKLADIDGDKTVSLNDVNIFMQSFLEYGFTPGEYQPITSMAIDKTALSLEKGKKSTLKATINPSTTTDSKKLVWTSENPDIATVDTNTGEVTAVKAGSTKIYVENVYGFKSTNECIVTVTERPITSVSINYVSIDLKIGTTKTLSGTVTPSNTTDDKTLTWSSSNESIATIDENGKVTAKSEGTAIITATTSNGKKATTTVNVYRLHISLDKTSLFVKKGNTASIKANVIGLTDKNVTWSSSNENVATVSSRGTIIAKTNGTTTITATASNGDHVNCIVTVGNFKKGDINHDNKVDLSDVYLALRISLKLDECDTNALETGDIDDDNKVDLSDVYRILRMSLGLE